MKPRVLCPNFGHPALHIQNINRMKLGQGVRSNGAHYPTPSMFRLLVCDANLDVRDSVRDLVLPLCAALVPGALVIITLKLGRRVGEQGVQRKVTAAKDLLSAAGIQAFRSVWLFSNSKNERTVIARKTL